MSFIEGIRRNARTAKWVGLLLIVGGVVSLIAPLAVGLSVALLVGVMLVFGGLCQLFLAFRAGSFGPGLLHFLMGALSLIVGLYMLGQPVVALASLTLFLAAYFIVSGVSELVWAFRVKPESGWGWLLFGGVVSLLLGLMIWRQFPLSGAWAVGILVGIRLLMSGFTLTAIGSAVGSVAKAVDEARA